MFSFLLIWQNSHNEKCISNFRIPISVTKTLQTQKTQWKWMVHFLFVCRRITWTNISPSLDARVSKWEIYPQKCICIFNIFVWYANANEWMAECSSNHSILTCNNRDGPLSSHAPSIPLSVCPESNPSTSTLHPTPISLDSTTISSYHFDDTNDQHPYDGPIAEAFWFNYFLTDSLFGILFRFSICFHLCADKETRKERREWENWFISNRKVIVGAEALSALTKWISNSRTQPHAK